MDSDNIPIQSSVRQAISEEAAKPRTIRVFFSSPFGGMEREREVLTRLFPEIASFCQAFGYDFIPIDLRWGITKEAADDAMVLWLCLKEIDMSDIFVGFYGMRYGWHDASGKDELLNNNFEKSKDDYPWILQYRLRSVTELEMRQGHLNNLGGTPSCFFFRNEAFDTQKVKDLEASGETGEIRKYRPESESANDLRHQLIREIKSKNSRQHLFGLKDYDTPDDGASKIHAALLSYLKVKLPNTLQPATTFRDVFLHRQVAFYSSKLVKSFVGGEDLFTQLTNHVTDSTVSRYSQKDLQSGELDASTPLEDLGPKPIVLVSGPGGGKSSAICHWMKKFIHSHQDTILFYHFIGSSSGSTNVRIILMRMILELYEGLELRGQTDGFESAPDAENLATKSLKDMTKDLGQVLKQIGSHNRSTLIIIDSLHVLPQSKRGRPLSWLPKMFPNGINVIVSISSKDVKLRRELVGKRRWLSVEITPLDQESQEEVISQVLKPRGKALSPNQTEKILSYKQCSNPLYLNIVLEEMVMFGDFFKLDAHMDNCLNTKNTKELFVKVIQRLSTDVKHLLKRDDILQQVLVGLHISNAGLSEKEIKHKVKLDQREWSQIFFSLEKYLSANGNILNFAYSELDEAVKELYLPQPEDVSSAARDLSDSFIEILESISSPKVGVAIDKVRVSRVATELPYLLSKTLSIPGQNDRLVSILSNMYIFSSLYSPSTKFDLIEYWNKLEWSLEEKGAKMSEAYRASLERFKLSNQTTSGFSIVDICDDLASFLIDSGFFLFSEEFYIQAREVQEEICKEDPNPNEKLADILNKLGNFYVDTEQFEKAYDAQTGALEIRKKLVEQAPDKESKDRHTSGMAMCYNGLAILCMGQKKYEEAVENFEITLGYHKQALGEVHQLVADTYNNIGTCYYTHKQYQEAINAFTDALNVYNQVYNDSLPPDLGGVLMNMAMCYRYLNNFPKAESLYKEALRIREESLGKDHPDIAHTLTAIGLFEIQRENYSIAEAHFKRGLKMFQAAYGNSHVSVAQACDNIAKSLIYMQNKPEALTYFLVSSNIYKKRKSISSLSISLMDNFVAYYQEQSEYLKAYQLLLDCIYHEQVQDEHFSLIEDVFNLVPLDVRPPQDPESTVEKGLEKFPGSETLLITKLNICTKKKETAPIKSLLEMNKFSSKAYFIVFSKFVQNDLLEDGLEILETFIQGEREDKFKIDALKELSIGYHTLKKFDKASEFLQQLCQLDPDNHTAKFNLGRLYSLPFYSFSDPIKSKSLFEEAIQLASVAVDEDAVNRYQVDLDNLNVLVP